MIREWTTEDGCRYRASTHGDADRGFVALQRLDPELTTNGGWVALSDAHDDKSVLWDETLRLDKAIGLYVEQAERLARIVLADSPLRRPARKDEQP